MATDERAWRGPWTGRVLYVLLALALIAAPLLPLDTEPRTYAAPDILLAVTAAWAARRPDTLPVLVVAAVFLLADLLFQRPPGLRTALVIGMTEWLRRRSGALRRGTFVGEWVAASGAIAAVALADRACLAVVFTPQPPLGLTLIQLILTIAAYPLVAGLAQVALGLRRPAQGEVDALGHRF